MDARVHHWLHHDGEGDLGGAWLDRWLHSRLLRTRFFEQDGVLVDSALYETRFACRPERCSPAAARGRYRSCCADLGVALSPLERQSLRRCAPVLAPTFGRRRLGDEIPRPGGRCLFSRIDRRRRIRCHLREVCHQSGLDSRQVQPVACRLFPLVLVQIPTGHTVLTVIRRDNHRAWDSLHPSRFPCLDDPTLPPLLDSMGPTIAWIFGRSFARKLRGFCR